MIDRPVAGDRLTIPWERAVAGTPTAEHHEGSLVLLLETCDRSLERLRATPEGRDRLLHHDLEIVRRRYAADLAALRG